MTKIWSISSVLKRGSVGEKVRIRGWVHSKGSFNGTQSLILRDGTANIQCTLTKDPANLEKFNVLKALPIESAIEITGLVKENSKVAQGYEILVNEMQVIHKAEEDYPIAKEDQSPKFMLDHRHLWLRSERMQTMMRVRSKLLEAVRDWFKRRGYTEIQGPILTTLPSSVDPTYFEVNYFDRKVYLAQGLQPYSEAMIASLGKVYTIAPYFRAEKSRNGRHLTEYWRIEAEAAWCDLNSIMKVQEGLVTHICQTLRQRATQELEALGRDVKGLLRVKMPFPRITYDEAVKMLQEDGIDLKWGENLDFKHETHLTSKFDKPIFVTHFPLGIQTLFHKSHPEKPELTLSADLLAPEGYGEISSSTQIIDNLEELLRKMERERLNPKDYQWLIDLKKYGSVPHSGFAMGVERTMTWICKFKDIKDAIAFPRFVNRVYP